MTTDGWILLLIVALAANSYFVYYICLKRVEDLLSIFLKIVGQKLRLAAVDGGVSEPEFQNLLSQFEAGMRCWRVVVQAFPWWPVSGPFQSDSVKSIRSELESLMEKDR